MGGSGVSDWGGDLLSIFARAEGPSSSSESCSARSGEEGSETSWIVSSLWVVGSDGPCSGSSGAEKVSEMEGLARLRNEGLPLSFRSERK